MEENIPIKVYFKTDENNNIIAVNSSIFLPDVTGWIEGDEGYGDRYAHAQGNYLSGPVFTDDGIPRYRWDGEHVIERTAEDIAADMAALPPPPLSETDKLKFRLQAAEQALLALIMKDMGGLPL